MQFSLIAACVALFIANANDKTADPTFQLIFLISLPPSFYQPPAAELWDHTRQLQMDQQQLVLLLQRRK